MFTSTTPRPQDTAEKARLTLASRFSVPRLFSLFSRSFSTKPQGADVVRWAFYGATRQPARFSGS
ncbi:hypothetical protein E2C01_043159 [Portunus trituberculatus]|uniref:Uncharacterized protein n=1 Tax=Portunus trituberculatus TaxID=210409 RepID=A0A5B7FNQ3_PORTR|nr:hypothetical protein [Portunus trituberculatus]